MTPLLTVAGVSCQYGAERVVQDVSFEVGEAEIVCLLGPSGCGKTTLLRAIAGLMPISSGTIAIKGRTLSSGGRGVPPERRNVAVVFQHYALWPHMSVAENVAYGPKRHGLPKAERDRRVADALRAVNIAELAGARPMQLSGGQQQRVGLARALAISPDVVLLDEPLSNLDAALRTELRAEITRTLRERGVAGVWVTHDSTEAFGFADRIAIMSGGRMVQMGAPEELYEYPADLATARFIGIPNVFQATVVDRALQAGGIAVPTIDVPSADLLVRLPPHGVRLVSLGPDTAPELRAVVTERRFAGGDYTYTVETGGGLFLTVDGERGTYAVGERVAIDIDPRAWQIPGPRPATQISAT